MSERATHLGLVDALRLGLRYIRGGGQAPINILSISLASAFYSHILIIDAAGGGGGMEGFLGIHRYWLLSVAVVVTVVSTATVMLISLYERYREIGVLKCLGALDRHVFLLLLVEALIQGALGGAFGLVLGFLSAIALVPLNSIVAFDAADFLRLSTTLILSTLISISSSLYPAYRAMRLNPIEALRYEV